MSKIQGSIILYLVALPSLPSATEWKMAYSYNPGGLALKKGRGSKGQAAAFMV